jgi:Lrp/AsnC family leucine-responsive transcriptional regulator
MSSQGLSQHDRAILEILQKEGRIAFADLGARVGLSTSSCWRRVEALESRGAIEGYAALVDPQSVGLGMEVFLNVVIDPQYADAFEQAITQRDEIVQCFAIAGEHDYLLHVLVADVGTLDGMLRGDLARLPGVRRIATTLCLKPVKRSSAIPIPKA